MRIKAIPSLLILISHLFTIPLFAQLATQTKKDTTVLSNYDLVKVKLAEIEYNKKAISSFGFGKATFSPTYIEKNTLYALTYSTNRWWINKYFAGGWFYDLGFTPEGGYSVGPQITGFAEFDSYILPYASFAIGFGYDVTNSDSYNLGKDRIYAPQVLKFGSFIFFKENRGFGIFAEINMYLNDESWPIYRVGIAWSKLKRS